MDNDRLTIRKPAVAGTFYPGHPVELTKTLATLYSEVDKIAIEGRPLGLIVPHAGYPYSGKIAAKAYKLLAGEEYDTVVIISPSHTVFFKGASVFEGNGYETPLGVVEIDTELSEKIASIHPLVYLSSMGHASGATRGEHALEVQLPFLQQMLGRFKLVAIVMGEQEEDGVRALGGALATALKETNTLLIASSDLSHFHSEKNARRLDRTIQEAVEKYDPSLLLDTLSDGKGEACGGGPIASVMMAAQRLGASTMRLVDYSTSAETTGDFDEVVGYLSAVMVAGKEVKARKLEIGQPVSPPPDKDLPVDAMGREYLRAVAHDAVAAALKKEDYLPPSNEQLELVEKGAFVSLHIEGQLRGCIGQIRGRGPLPKVIAEMAVAAAFDDPRFDPVTIDELKDLEIEISVLSRLYRIRDISKIEVGRDGLMVKLDLHSGLLLPQVAVESGWSSVQFLEQTCLKAGLPKNSYKDSQAEIYRFEAEVF